MNLSNIISAGRMMAIVVALLGAFKCGATLALPSGDAMAWNIALGVAFIVCGLALMVMFGRVAGCVRSAESPSVSSSDSTVYAAPASACVPESKAALTVAPHLAILDTAILAVGALVMLLAVTDTCLGWQDPFSWMMATVGLAVFIDTLCLKIDLSRR